MAHIPLVQTWRPCKTIDEFDPNLSYTQRPLKCTLESGHKYQWRHKRVDGRYPFVLPKEFKAQAAERSQ